MLSKLKKQPMIKLQKLNIFNSFVFSNFVSLREKSEPGRVRAGSDVALHRSPEGRDRQQRPRIRDLTRRASRNVPVSSPYYIL